jgi:hypothetical protein
MRKPFIALAGTTALMLGSAVSVKAIPLSPGASSQDQSPIEEIGCVTAGDNCPYGYRIERHGGKGWSCEPCGDQKQGSRYRDWNDRYSEPRRYYRGYGDYQPRRYYRDYGDYGPRQYQEYDERYYQPRYYRDY